MYRFRVFIFFITITISSAALVKWSSSKSFNLPINFKEGKLPCSKQLVVFPEITYESIRIQNDVSVSGFILPKNGEFTIDDATINLGYANDNCTEDGNVYYLPRSKSAWAQPDVWTSPKINEATPDAERIPCYNDEVEFPENAEISVDLPDETQSVGKLKALGYNFTTAMFSHFVNFELTDQFNLNSFHGTGVVVEQKICSSRTGCPCQMNMPKIQCSTKFCPVPKCINPIQPIGHCCKICGGYLTLDIDNSFDLMAFEESVARIVDSYGQNDLIYHVGRLPENKVQVVVVDKGQYVGTSAEVVHAIGLMTDANGIQGLAQISGSPLDKAGLGGKIALSMFFAVIIAMGAIYAYYYKIPELRFPITYRSNRGIVSRFDRRTDSVVSLTSRRDSGVLIGPSTGTAFRNPMYDSKRGREQVAESTADDALTY